ncbi:MAG: type II toxin-antitoxin system VapB family antitoxin [Spirochaetales bacterium]|nr:type II toxin-antitoxin system VapB family antitoxin [Spirochaetales bacterium]
MATNLAIDDKLLNEAKKLGKFASKKETVNSALREFIERRKQKQIVKLFGTIQYDADYDYKRLRDRKSKER